MRDECLKLHSRCGHLKKPMDVVRYLEDELSKVESKLINFPELKLSEADKVSLILQAISVDARQYVVLHGHSNDWSSVSTTLKFYEEQLRVCELPGSSSSRALSEIICDHCGKKGHKKENCWQRKREERENAKEGGKTRPSRDGGKDHGKGKGKDDKGKSKGKGKDKGKGKGKDKSKKKKKGARARSASSDGSSASSSGDEGRAAAMALRASGDVRDLSFCLPETEDPTRSHVSRYRSRYCLGTLGSSSGQLDVDRVCSVQNVEPRDVWLVDSGATCHIVSSLHLSSFRVLKRHNRTVTLLNASGGEIVVHEVVDIEVHFDKLRLRLEDVLVADVTFNVLSPWSAAEKGWRTHLYRTGSTMFRGKRNLKLEGVNRAWWALSGSKKSTSKRQPSGGKDMEIDSVAGKQPVRGPSPPPGILRKSPEDQEARSSSGTPRSLETTRSSEMSSRHVLEGSPFAFLVRSMHIAPCRGREYDSKEVLYDGEVETCVVDPGSDVGSPKFRAACFEESKHVVHGCALRDLGRMCMDVREAQTCDATLEQVSKSRQTHEHCVAEDLVLKPGSEAVRDASLELERYVEGSCAAKLSLVPPGHRRAGCGLIDVLTSVMLLAKAQLCIAVGELFSAAVMILVSCSCAWTGEILSCRRMERALIGLRIPFWLKIAVVFATALCIRAEGVQPCCPAVGLKAEGIQPGCVAIGIRSEEAKPLSSDYVCSLSSYCRRDGSFEDSGYGSAACSQPNYVQDDEQGRYKGVPAPIRRCLVRLFGVAGCETSIESAKQCFSGGGSHVAVVCSALMDQPEMISGPPTLSRLWFGVTSPSLAASIALERSLWLNQLHHPCVQKTSVFAYLVMKFASSAQDNCGRAVCLPSQKARSALVYLTSTNMDSVEEGALAKRRRISSVGVITDEVQKRLLERLSKGYLGAYLWESGIRGQDIENCLKAERRSGVAVLAISAMQNCLRVYESLKIDEVRAMRQQFPMKLRGKQIGHILGYIPGAVYGQAVLQGMSRAYQDCGLRCLHPRL